mmetsp:Transcript_36864/g.105631  ORF Transcript_36864/g.105631 Transcript_36864/m.105631 type:complete len:133 (+) Transcript_36864:692-1090(+)
MAGVVGFLLTSVCVVPHIAATGLVECLHYTPIHPSIHPSKPSHVRVLYTKSGRMDEREREDALCVDDTCVCVGTCPLVCSLPRQTVLTLTANKTSEETHMQRDQTLSLWAAQFFWRDVAGQPRSDQMDCSMD